MDNEFIADRTAKTCELTTASLAELVKEANEVPHCAQLTHLSSFNFKLRVSLGVAEHRGVS